MADGPVPAVVGLGVDAVDVAHDARQVGPPRVQDEMVVIAHQAIGENAAVESRERPTQHVQPDLAVRVVVEDLFATVSSGGPWSGRIVSSSAKHRT